MPSASSTAVQQLVFATQDIPWVAPIRPTRYLTPEIVAHIETLWRSNPNQSTREIAARLKSQFNIFISASTAHARRPKDLPPIKRARTMNPRSRCLPHPHAEAIKAAWVANPLVSGPGMVKILADSGISASTKTVRKYWPEELGDFATARFQANPNWSMESRARAIKRAIRKAERETKLTPDGIAARQARLSKENEIVRQAIRQAEIEATQRRAEAAMSARSARMERELPVEEVWARAAEIRRENFKAMGLRTEDEVILRGKDGKHSYIKGKEGPARIGLKGMAQR